MILKSNFNCTAIANTAPQQSAYRARLNRGYDFQTDERHVDRPVCKLTTVLLSTLTRISTPLIIIAFFYAPMNFSASTEKFRSMTGSVHATRCESSLLQYVTANYNMLISQQACHRGRFLDHFGFLYHTIILRTLHSGTLSSSRCLQRFLQSYHPVLTR